VTLEGSHQIAAFRPVSSESFEPNRLNRDLLFIAKALPGTRGVLDLKQM
jgi:hypothetical protein